MSAPKIPPLPGPNPVLTKHLAAMNALSDFVQKPSREAEQAMREAEGEFRAAVAQAAPSQGDGKRVDLTEVVKALRDWSATKWNTESPLDVSIAMTAAGSAILMARLAIESLQASTQREQPSSDDKAGGEVVAWQERQSQGPGEFTIWYPCKAPSPRATHDGEYLSLHTDGITYQWRPVYTHPQPKADRPAEQANGQEAAVYPPDGTTSPFTVINLGQGAVQMGDAIHDDRLPALWFGKNGKGMGHIEDLNRRAYEGETLAAVTFSNVDGLDVLLDVVHRIRAKAFPDAVPYTTPPAQPAREWKVDLGFDLREEKGVWLVVEDGAEDREATLTERVLWDALMGKNAGQPVVKEN